jgi:hypothetical protein
LQAGVAQIVPTVIFPGQATVSVTGFVQLIGAPAGTPFLYIVGALVGSWPADIATLQPLLSTSRQPYTFVDTSGYFNPDRPVILGPDNLSNPNGGYNKYDGNAQSGKAAPASGLNNSAVRTGPQIVVAGNYLVVPGPGSNRTVAVWDGTAWTQSPSNGTTTSRATCAVGPSAVTGYPIASLLCSNSTTAGSFQLNAYDPVSNTWVTASPPSVGINRATANACDLQDGYGIVYTPFITTGNTVLTVFKADPAAPEDENYTFSAVVSAAGLGLGGQGFAVIESIELHYFEHNVGTTFLTRLEIDIADPADPPFLVPIFNRVNGCAWIAPDLAVVVGRDAFVDDGVTYYVPRIAFVHIGVTTVSVSIQDFDDLANTNTATGAFEARRVPNPTASPTVFFIARSVGSLSESTLAYVITAGEP